MKHLIRVLGAGMRAWEDSDSPAVGIVGGVVVWIVVGGFALFCTALAVRFGQ